MSNFSRQSKMLKETIFSEMLKFSKKPNLKITFQDQIFQKSRKYELYNQKMIFNIFEHFVFFFKI